MICDKKKCTGCFACKNICPHNAIEMKEDEFGNIYPNIDKKKCIDCGLCKKICPSNTNIEFNFPQKCYAMTAKNKTIHKTSTSGGAATVFSKYIIEEKKGVVYGAAFVNKKVQHIRVDNTNDLIKLQGSKYVHSYIEESYRKVKDDLQKNKYVLFIGTPCQVSGLKNFLNKEYEKLYLIDLICHGVPSQKLLNEEIKSYNLNEKYTKISFREMDKYNLKVQNNTDTLIEREMSESLYYLAFMRALTHRENCYNCLYAKPERTSDITIGDFWGIDEKSIIYENVKSGISVLLPCTEKGNELINLCTNMMNIEKRSIEEAINGNTQLRHPSIPHCKREYFIKNYNKLGYIKTLKNIFWTDLIKAKIKNILKRSTWIYSIYKKIKEK